MIEKNYDIVIIGGGPAGLASAISAYDNGVKDVLILEREDRVGGILNQCIHNGFGLTRFKESLTGPEYAYRYAVEVEKRKIQTLVKTTVLSIEKDKTILAINEEKGVITIKAKAIILAMGCRERSKGALNIAGSRPSGIFSAGTAQKYVNVKGYMPGKEVVILGSGDIGLIMARRMTLEGAKVKAVCEIMPYSSGLKRNVVQCLNDFNIPLYLSHTITKIHGKDRVSGVTISKVDEKKRPIPNTEMYFDCDTILFSVGLIPENELSKGLGVPLSPKTKGAIVYQDRQTLVDGVFACGNVLHVHDLVDFVSEESALAGINASNYVKEGSKKREEIDCVSGKNIGYVLPQKIDKNIKGDVKIYFRVTGAFKNVKITLENDGKIIKEKNKKVVLPGEMEYIILKEKEVQGLKGELLLKVEEEI